MGISLANDIRERASETEPLKEVARAKHGEKVLAVAETATGEYVLCREREQGAKGADGKRSRDNGVEKSLKRTAYLADFAHALACGLIAE